MRESNLIRSLLLPTPQSAKSLFIEQLEQVPAGLFFFPQELTHDLILYAQGLVATLLPKGHCHKGAA